MPDPSFPSEDGKDSQALVRATVTSPSLSAPPSSPEKGEGDEEFPEREELVEDAKWQGFQDAKMAVKDFRNQPYDRIDYEVLQERIEEILDRLLEKKKSSGWSAPGAEQYHHFLRSYKAAYKQQFDDWLRESKLHVPYQEERIPSRLREMALQDRSTYPTYASREGRFHQRDLAVTRVLIFFQITLESEKDDHLEFIHKYADMYEDYFRNPRSEVTWPTQHSFRH